jgi:hypothetical protein
MEETRREGSQQASNLVPFSTEQVEQLSSREKSDRCNCSFGQTSGRFSFDIVDICATVSDEEEEEGDPFSPTGSETMEEPSSLKPRERRVSDVIDSIGDCVPYTNDYRILSPPEKIIGTRGPDSPVSLGYGSVDSGTPKSSVSPDSPKKLLKVPQIDVTDAFPVSENNSMSSR